MNTQRKRRSHPEDDMQRALFRWIDLAKARIPQLRVAFHPANGGYRNKIEAARLKGLGVRAGVPDVMIPASSRGYNGLAIELKAGKNKPSEEQLNWCANLSTEGWLWVACWSFDEAHKTIAEYFGVKP